MPGALALLLSTIAVLVAPGWLLLRLLGWPRSVPEQLLLAGPTSFAGVAVAAALAGKAGWALTLTDVLVFDAVLAVLVTALWMRPRGGGAEPEERLPWFAMLLGLAPGALFLGLTLHAVGGINPPPSEDSLVHATVLRWFLDGHAAPPMLVDRLDGTSTPETRFGWHAAVALLAPGSGQGIPALLTIGDLAVVAMLPGSLMLFAHRAGLVWRAAWIAALAGLGIGIVPFRILALGQAPLLCGAFVVAPAAAVLAVDAMRTLQPAPAFLAVLLAGGVLFVHPSDAPTLALLTLTLCVATRLRPPLRVPSARAVAVALSAVAALTALVLIWLRYRGTTIGGGQGTPTVSTIDAEGYFTARHLSGFVGTVLGTLTTSVHDLALPALAALAVIAGIRRPPVQGLALLGVLLLGLQIDAWGWQWPARLMGAVYPWSAPERLLSLDWFVLPPLAAAGAELVAGALRRAFRRASLAGLVGSSAVVALSVAPVLGPGPRLLEGAEAQQMALRPTDAAFIAHLPDVVPPDDLILTDGTADSGGWIGALTTSRTLLIKGWEQSSAAPKVRAALSGLCQPGTATRLHELGVSWVYLGSTPATSEPYADRTCTRGTDGLRLVDVPGTEAGPRLYEVTSG